MPSRTAALHLCCVHSSLESLQLQRGSIWAWWARLFANVCRGSMCQQTLTSLSTTVSVSCRSVPSCSVDEHLRAKTHSDNHRYIRIDKSNQRRVLAQTRRFNTHRTSTRKIYTHCAYTLDMTSRSSVPCDDFTMRTSLYLCGLFVSELLVAFSAVWSLFDARRTRQRAPSLWRCHWRSCPGPRVCCTPDAMRGIDFFVGLMFHICKCMYLTKYMYDIYTYIHA